MLDSQPNKPVNFCASDAQMCRFCKRKSIKFRKKKSGKTNNREENLDIINKISEKILNLNSHKQHFHSIVVALIFLHEHTLRANLSTFLHSSWKISTKIALQPESGTPLTPTNPRKSKRFGGDKDAHISCSSESSCKRQLTVCTAERTGEAEDRHVHTSLIYKLGPRGRLKPYEDI